MRIALIVLLTVLGLGTAGLFAGYTFLPGVMDMLLAALDRPSRAVLYLIFWLIGAGGTIALIRCDSNLRRMIITTYLATLLVTVAVWCMRSVVTEGFSPENLIGGCIMGLLVAMPIGIGILCFVWAWDLAVLPKASDTHAAPAA